jgi:hypothetical protein
MNKLERLVAHRPVFAALVLVMLVRLLTALPLDASLPGGTDTASHLFRVWHIQQYGMTGWSPHWYGGFDFLASYSPLFYLLAGTLAAWLGHVLSYKLIVDIFWLLTPLCFLLLLREWKLSPPVTAAALAFFSLLPTNAYYLYDGRHPTLIALPLALLYLKFALRASANRSGWFPAGLFLSAAILAHLLTATFAVVISLAFLARRRPNLSILASWLLAVTITSPWLAAFALNTVSNPTTTILGVTSPIATVAPLVTASYLRFLDYPWTPPLVATILVALGLLTLLSLRRPGRPVTDALLMLVLIGALVSFVSYNRAFVFVSVPLALLAARGLATLPRWRLAASMLVILLLLVPVVHPLPVAARQFPALPSGQGRVLLLPAGSLAPSAGASWEAYLLPAAGADYILGWYPQVESVTKTTYNAALQRPSTSPDYMKLLRAGWVNYILVDRTSNLTGIFDSPDYRIADSTTDFTLYALQTPATYIELDGTPLAANVSRQADTIVIRTNCTPGILTIKESWAIGWSAQLNGIPIKLYPDKHGFTYLAIGSAGPCTIYLDYSPFR